MKWITIFFAALIMSCCGNKAVRSSVQNVDETGVLSTVADTLPVCINEMIKRFEEEPVQNPPRKILSYQYNGNEVFYVTPPCCDFFSELYDRNCNLLGHPDGGITGKGDGKIPDFAARKKNEKLVWEDKRNQGNKK